MELNMQYMDPMGIPISNDLLSLSETAVAPLKTWWFCWKNGKTTFVLGKPIFRGEIFVSGRGPRCFLHAWVGWILHTLVRRKIYFWSQQNRSFASCILMICYMSLPTAKVSNECRTPQGLSLSSCWTPNVLWKTHRNHRNVMCGIFTYIWISHKNQPNSWIGKYTVRPVPWIRHEYNKRMDGRCSICRLTTLNQVLQSVWRPAERRPDTQGQPLNCVKIGSK